MASASRRGTAKPVPGRAAASRQIEYRPQAGIDEFVYRIASATPLELVDVERAGVEGRFLKDVARRMNLPATRLFAMAGVPKATVEKKATSGERLSGRGGQAALGIARLLAKAQAIVDDSTRAEAKDFDTAEWLGRWLETPQPSLGGRKPGDLIDTPTGLELVLRLLGALESGAYQ